MSKLIDGNAMWNGKSMLNSNAMWNGNRRLVGNHRLLHLLLIMVCWSHLESQLAAEQPRPNILWITSEDNSHHWLGCYGNEDAQTPNLDQLAAEGTRFQFAYSNAPVCAVARFTLLTGRYACGMGTQNMRSRYPIPKQFRTYVSAFRDAGYYCANRAKTDYNFLTKDKEHWDQSGGKAHWRKRGKDQPFLAVFNTNISHESSLFANKLSSARERGTIPEQPTRDPDSVKLPPHLPDTIEIRRDWVRYMDVITAMDQQVGRWLKELDDAGERDNTIVIYCSDHGGILPRSKRYLYDTGTHVPLIIRIPERWKHLSPEPAGSANQRPVGFIDIPPTLLSLAGIAVPREMQGRAFLGAQRQEAETYVFLFGQRFDSRMLRFVRGVTDGRFRYIRNFHPHRDRGIRAGYPHGQEGWRSLFRQHVEVALPEGPAAIWKNPQPVEELYDTRADRWEVNNLAMDARYYAVLSKMRAATVNKMKEIRDTGLVPESMYGDISKNGTVFDYVQDPKFPFDEVMDAALMASNGRQSDPEKLSKAMSNTHPVVRYWGAVGCTVRGELQPQQVDALHGLLNDSSTTVQFAAAEALITHGTVADRTAGIAAFARGLSETKEDRVALEGLNLVLNHGLASQISSEILRQAAQTGDYSRRLLQDFGETK